MKKKKEKSKEQIQKEIDILKERMKTKSGLVDQNIAVKLSQLYQELGKVK